MIKLLKLRFENVGRFVEMQTIDFSNKQKLLQFDGRNENTGGSSGSGKSTVFHALDLLLGINDTPVTGLQSRLTKSGFCVSGDFDIDGVLVKITRSKKDGLKIETPSETVEGSSKIAEEKLDALLGISRKLFKKMVHKKQKEGGFFLNLTAKESYEFLIECLGLQEWEAKSEKIAKDIKDKEAVVAGIESQLNLDSSKLSSLQSTLSSIVKPEPLDVKNLEETIALNKKHIEGYQETERKIKSELELKINHLNQDLACALPPEPKIDQAKDILAIKTELSELSAKEAEEKSKWSVTDHDVKIKNLNSKISEFSYKEKEIKSLVGEISELKKHAAHLEEAKCPTCAQTWVGESAASKLQNFKQSIESKTSQVLEFKAILENLPRLQEMVVKVEEEKKANLEQITQTSVKFANLKAGLNNKLLDIQKESDRVLQEWRNQTKEIELSFRQQIADLEKAVSTTLSAGQSAKFLSQEQLKDAQNLIQSYNSQMESYEKSSANLKKDIENTTASIESKQSQLKTATKELKLAEEAHRLIKSYMLQIFQDTLNFIGSQATVILNAVPAMANATLYFENCKETKTGKIKDEVNCVINIDGENDINIKTLSGGERTAVDLAVDLAVIETIESQTGKGADWIILDEPFNGMDSISCEAAIDIIKQVGIKKRIIIVDHQEVVKQIVEETITIHRKGLESEVLNGI